MIWPAPNSSSVRLTQERNIWAGIVISTKSFFSIRQLSHIPQAACAHVSPKYCSRGMRRQRSVSAKPRSAQEDIGNLLFLFRFLCDKVLDISDITISEQQQAMGGQAVPSGPADLLVVVVDASGQVVMDDETDIGFVDPHAEGDRRHDDLDIVPDEQLLIFRALLFRQTRMVRPDGIALPMKRGVRDRPSAGGRNNR